MIDPAQLQDKAAEIGFDTVGLTSAETIAGAQIDYLRQWLAAGHAADMTWLHRNFYKRISPANLLEGAQSVVIGVVNYKPPEKAVPPPQPSGRVAHYARYDDYHSFMRARLRQLADYLVQSVPGDHRFRVCVDSAPLAERALAMRAGLGFVGRNHLLTHRQLGPEIFLGEIITTIPIHTAGSASKSAPQGFSPAFHREEPPAIDEMPLASAITRADDHPCARCDRCVKACPTRALSPDGDFDARKCISYLTIEHDGPIDPALAPKIGNRLFGCDNCAIACPFSAEAPPASNPELKYHPQRAYIKLDHILSMTERQFDEQFADSPMHRTGLQNLQKNARICGQNLNAL